MALEQLTDVHTRRNAQRVEDNVDRGTVSHVGHVLDRQNVTDNALVAVATGDLIALLDLTTLGDVDAHLLVDAGGQVVAVLAAKADDVDDAAISAVRHLKGGVANIVSLGTEDGAQQALLGGQSALALRRDLADQDVARADLGAMRMMPSSSRLASMSSERFGISRVISSGPSLVSRASIS